MWPADVWPAVATVIYAKGEAVSPAQFSTVYKAFTGCTPDQDIFTAANFLDIDPNRALSQMIDEFERQENAIRRAA